MSTPHKPQEESRTDLESITPVEAKRLWVESRVDEVAQATLDLQKHHAKQFVEWLNDKEITDMRDVSSRIVHRFRLQIKGEVAQNTLAQRLSTVRRFLSFCASINAVDPEIPERIELPNRTAESRTETLESDQADAVLSYLRKYSYASREHALIAITWHTGIRTGTVRSLDLTDVETDNNRLRVRHRPETDTPLKNKQAAERYVALSSEVVEVVLDYMEHNRVTATDEHDRKPLFTTENGRAPVKTLRRWFQMATRPCMFGDCPHGRDPNECDAAKRQRDASDCPSSVSGHPIRRGAITHHLRKDVPEKVVSDRCNVSSDVLDQHYDRRTEDEKTEKRREHLDGI